ncbi:apolipoprotein R-like isoform X3 [Carcharodon carcharias]|uniref:apolipoprotein R-like isoform X3 n=1 Tax=Carcharodon carcharias TaxID=13397 RepID=UPI001B7F6B08|nr:apolipoprotein R-like isoform X3 [Carcharodon carcharias]
MAIWVARVTARGCGNPGEIMNGYETSDTTLGNKVTFHCDEGYKLVGSDYQICTYTGWSGVVPTYKKAFPPVNFFKEIIAIGHQITVKEENVIKAKYQLLESEREILRLKENLIEKAEQYADENE